MDKVYYLKQNKYIRLMINRPTRSFRASISINKYCWNERENRYYEINFETFHPYDYKDEEDALEKAKEWLENEFKKFQARISRKSLGGSYGRRYNKRISGRKKCGKS